MFLIKFVFQIAQYTIYNLKYDQREQTKYDRPIILNHKIMLNQLIILMCTYKITLDMKI